MAPKAKKKGKPRGNPSPMNDNESIRTSTITELNGPSLDQAEASNVSADSSSAEVALHPKRKLGELQDSIEYPPQSVADDKRIKDERTSFHNVSRESSPEEDRRMEKRQRRSTTPNYSKDEFGKDKEMPLDKSLLPAEMWQAIFKYLDPKTLARLLWTCRNFRAYVSPRRSVEDLEWGFPTLPKPVECSITIRGIEYIFSCGKLLRLLEPNSVWKASRRLYFPGMPEAVAGFPEWKMWRLLYRINCQFCGKEPSSREIKPSNKPWEAGPGSDDVRTIWPFAIRCCGPCFGEKTAQEDELFLSSLPHLANSILPFVFATPDMNVVMPNALRTLSLPSNIQLRKRFLQSDMKGYETEMEEQKALSEERRKAWWRLQETLAERSTLEMLDWQIDYDKWVKWEEHGGWRQLGLPGQFANNSAEMHIKSERPSIESFHRGSDNGLNNPAAFDVGFGPSFAGNGTPNLAVVKPEPGLSQSIGPVFPNPSLPPTSFYRHPPPEQRTQQRSNLIKAQRKEEIERRCLLLDPPIPGNVLIHLDAFQAALQIPLPMDDKAWESLKDRLIPQRPMGEARAAEQAEQDQLNERRIAERRRLEEAARQAREIDDEEWDQAQLPIRERLGAYADEFIAEEWGGGTLVTRLNCPDFAAAALLYVRKRFYDDVRKEDHEAYERNEKPKADVDGRPPTRKLILENMKWVFDEKIKGLTETHKKELFLCHDCGNLTKFYGFEGVVQHFAAKHTNALSLGSIVVHWRAEWPESPPFHPHPVEESSRGRPRVERQEYGQPYEVPPPPHGMYTFGGYPQTSGPAPYPVFTGVPGQYGNQSPFPQYPGAYPTGQQGPYRPPQGYRGPPQPYPGSSQTYGRPPLPHNYGPGAYNARATPYPSGPPFQPPPPAISSPHPGQPYPAPLQDPRLMNSSGNGSFVQPYGQNTGSNQSFQQPYQHGPLAGPIGPNQPQFPPEDRDTPERRVRESIAMKEMAGTAKDIWFGTGNVRNLPDNVRIFTLIHHVAANYKTKVRSNLSLDLFVEGLKHHPDLRPLNDTTELVCKTCMTNDVLKSDEYHYGHVPSTKPGRAYTLLALLDHFKSMHVDHPLVRQAQISLDWTRDMIFLPAFEAIRDLIHARGMDDKTLQLIDGAFPGIFPRPLPKLGSSNNMRSIPAAGDDAPVQTSPVDRSTSRATLRSEHFASVKSEDLGVALTPRKHDTQGATSRRREKSGNFPDAHQAFLKFDDDQYDPSRPSLLPQYDHGARSLTGNRGSALQSHVQSFGFQGSDPSGDIHGRRAYEKAPSNGPRTPPEDHSPRVAVSYRGQGASFDGQNLSGQRAATDHGFADLPTQFTKSPSIGRDKVQAPARAAGEEGSEDGEVGPSMSRRGAMENQAPEAALADQFLQRLGDEQPQGRHEMVMERGRLTTDLHARPEWSMNQDAVKRSGRISADPYDNRRDRGDEISVRGTPMNRLQSGSWEGRAETPTAMLSTQEYGTEGQYLYHTRSSRLDERQLGVVENRHSRHDSGQGTWVYEDRSGDPRAALGKRTQQHPRRESTVRTRSRSPTRSYGTAYQQPGSPLRHGPISTIPNYRTRSPRSIPTTGGGEDLRQYLRGPPRYQDERSYGPRERPYPQEFVRVPAPAEQRRAAYVIERPAEPAMQPVYVERGAVYDTNIPMYETSPPRYSTRPARYG